MRLDVVPNAIVISEAALRARRLVSPSATHRLLAGPSFPLERTSQQRGVCLLCGRCVGARADRIAASTLSSFTRRLSCNQSYSPCLVRSRTMRPRFHSQDRRQLLTATDCCCVDGADSHSAIPKRFRRIEARYWRVFHTFTEQALHTFIEKRENAFSRSTFPHLSTSSSRPPLSLVGRK